MSDDVSVIIVTFNSGQTIKKCLESIFKDAPGSEVLVVDNNSQDKTVEEIKKFKKKVILIEPSENLGFARACNLAAKQANGDFLLFLNPDAYFIKEQSVEKLVQALSENDDYGPVGPKLILPNGKVQKSVRNLPTVFGAFLEYILGLSGKYDFYQPNCTSLCKVESVVGACILIKKNVFKRVGGFDEKYFLYFEDLELCRSVKKSGLKVGYLPKVEVGHVVGVSGKNQKTLDLLCYSSKKYHGLISFYIIEFIIRLGRFLHG